MDWFKKGLIRRGILPGTADYEHYVWVAEKAQKKLAIKMKGK